MEYIIDGTEDSPEVFWGELAPCDHMVQMYEDDCVFLDALEGFVAGGLRAGDATVLIATPGHLSALATRLSACGIQLDAAIARDQYIALDAEATMAEFLVDGWPDDAKFQTVVGGILHRARQGGRKVRVFGEMVALMWGQGHNGGTVRLEHLWHRLCKAEAFSLFCAYPKSGFTADSRDSVQAICAAHSRVISGRRRMEG